MNNSDSSSSSAKSLREQHEVQLRNSSGQGEDSVDSLHFLATWHLERNNLQLAVHYFGHLASLLKSEPNIWITYSIVCALAGEIESSHRALAEVIRLLEKPEEDIRIKYCQGLLYERRSKLTEALEMYYHGIDICDTRQESEQIIYEEAAARGDFESENAIFKRISNCKEMRVEFLLRVALIKKGRGELGDGHLVVNLIFRENPLPKDLRANASCLRGTLCEAQQLFQRAEIAYKEAIDLIPGHITALEGLGRVYLRYRECIPTAVSCFFQSIQSNPCSHISWYLVGRCYAATSQYLEALTAYRHAVNIDPNDANTWCSIGILYYAHSQYEEAEGAFRRTLRLEPCMPEAWYNLGVVCDRIGEAREAHLAFNKSRQFGLADRLQCTGLELYDGKRRELIFPGGLTSGVGVGGNVVGVGGIRSHLPVNI